MSSSRLISPFLKHENYVAYAILFLDIEIEQQSMKVIAIVDEKLQQH